ncbi:MAG TPA: diaminopimelate decarboxylase [Actinomycetota bacterium]|nr:diaminopimelate decarboxylase [Actinomycetota bacterium]
MQPVGGGPWPAGAAFTPDGLSIRRVMAAALAEEFGTPLVVVDEDHVRARCREFRDGYPRALWAVKAFPVRALIRIALEEGLGLLASTGGELDTCLRAGADPDVIVLHGNNKSDEEIDRAVSTGIGLLIADREDELPRIATAAERARRTQPILLRVAPGIDVQAHEYVKTGAPDTKFGTPLAEGLALRALRRAVELPGIEPLGIHLHLGSQLLEAKPYLAALTVALDFLAEAKEAFGFEARLLDLGGGMGTSYTEEHPLSPATLGAEVREALVSGCEARGLPVPELLGEPGRAITSGSAVTLYRVGSIKEVPGVRTYVAVDGGISDNIRPALYGAKYTLALVSRKSSAEERPVTVVGRHCESGDVLARDVSLPRDLRAGDLLAFASTGAYEYAMASNYNKVGRPAVVLVRDGRARLAVRRETLDDLARLDVD